MRIENHPPAASFRRKVRVDGLIWSYEVDYPQMEIRSPLNTATFATDVYEINEEDGGEEDWNLPISPALVKFFILDKILHRRLDLSQDHVRGLTCVKRLFGGPMRVGWQSEGF